MNALRLLKSSPQYTWTVCVNIVGSNCLNRTRLTFWKERFSTSFFCHKTTDIFFLQFCLSWVVFPGLAFPDRIFLQGMCILEWEKGPPKSCSVSFDGADHAVEYKMPFQVVQKIVHLSYFAHCHITCTDSFRSIAVITSLDLWLWCCSRWDIWTTCVEILSICLCIYSQCGFWYYRYFLC